MLKVADPDLYVRSSSAGTIGVDGQIFLDPSAKTIQLVNNFLLIDGAADVTFGSGDGSITAGTGTPFAEVKVGDSITLVVTGGALDGTYIVDSWTSSTVISVVATFAGETPASTDLGILYEGYNLKFLYSFLKEEWTTDAVLIRVGLPMEPITDYQFNIVRDWNFLDQTTKNLIRDAGWALVTAGVNVEEYINVTTLGTVDDQAVDQAYYQQVDGAAPIDIVLTGNVNQAVQVYSAPALSNFDRRDYFKMFLREQGKTFASYDLISQQNIASLEYTRYQVPLENGADLDISASDVYVAFNETEATSWVIASKVLTTTDIDFTGLAIGDKVSIVSAGNTDTTRLYTLTAVSTNSITVSEAINDESIAAGTVKSVHQSMSLTWFPDLTPADTDFTGLKTMTCAGETFITDGYKPGQHIRIAGSTSNDGVYEIETVDSETAISFVGTPLAANDANDANVVINQAREVDTAGVYRDYGIILDANGGSKNEVYEYSQWAIRQNGTVDIDAGSGTVRGDIADSQVEFVGPTLKTKLTADGGIHIDNYAIADTNDLVMVDDLGQERGFPFVAAGTIQPNVFLQDSSDSIVRMFFKNSDAGDYTGTDISFDTTDDSINYEGADSTFSFAGLVAGQIVTIAGSTSNDGNYTVASSSKTKLVVSENLTTEAAGQSVSFTTAFDYETIYAVLVKDNDGVDIAYDIASRASIAWSYDFDNNVQRGPASAGTVVPIVVAALGTDKAQFVAQEAQIVESTQNVITLVAAFERTYGNPVA